MSKLFAGLCLFSLALLLLPAAVWADSPSDLKPFFVALPPYGALQVAVNGHCLDYGLPFPGQALTLAGLADDEVRLSVAYNLVNGHYVQEDLFQAQWAIWHFTDQVDISGDKNKLAADIVAYATSGTPADLDPGSTSLVDAAAKGWVSVALNDFVNVSDPAYFGKGTLVIENKTDATLALHIPYGVVFKDAKQTGVQDMAIFPSALPQADPAQQTMAARETVCNPLSVRLPANQTANVLISGHCLNYGLPFPGQVIRSLALSPEVIRNTICYNLAKGYLEQDLWQAQLAVWRQTDDLDKGDAFPLVDEIATYAESGIEPGDIGAGCVALPDAVDKGLVSATIDDFTNMSDPAYFGKGTLVLTNLTGTEQVICIPFGTTFKDETQTGVQDMGIFASMRPDPDDLKEPQTLPESGGDVAASQILAITLLLAGLALMLGGWLLRLKRVRRG
ncbi:MAG: hypothetical protein JXM73_22805 [Anaerolineae bacterium]|nr:hypothetical protein [Anaerolineae bacterium]